MSLQKSPSFFLNFSNRDMKGENGHYYGFGRFTLDVAEQRLSDGKRTIPLTPKSFDVLSLLVQNAGHLVEKEDLMKQVWPDSFVEEANVARIVHTLRKRLGDDGNGNSFIETVPTKGYRFVASVEIRRGRDDEDDSKNVPLETLAIGSLTSGAAALTETLSATRYRRRYFTLAAVVFLGVMATGFLISTASQKSRALATLFGHSLNGEAYRNFQEGKFLVETRAPKNYDQALEKFEKATELDPENAEAWAGKGDVKFLQFMASQAYDDILTARAAVDKALALDPNNVYGHTIHCRIRGTNDWEFEEAVTECQRAVELDPNDAGAHRELGFALNVVGRENDALAQMEMAAALSPTSNNKFSLGMIRYLSRRYDEAIDELERVETTDPSFTTGATWLMLCFAMKNDHAKAFEYLVKLEEKKDIDPEDLNAVKAAFANGGWPAAVRASLNAPTGFGPKPSFYPLAVLHAHIGEKDAAFEILEQLHKSRKIGLVNIARDPMLDPIRDDPRYSAIVSEMHLK